MRSATEPLRVRSAVAFLLLSSCSAPDELVAQERTLAMRLDECKYTASHLEERRAEQAKLEQELKAFQLDRPAVEAVVGPKAKIVDTTVQATITLPGASAKEGLATLDALLTRQPELRLLSFEVRGADVVLEVATSSPGVATPPGPPTITRNLPPFCSRACKDLLARALKEEAELAKLEGELGPLVLIPSQRALIATARAIQAVAVPTRPSLVLLDQLVAAPFFAGDRKLTFLMDGANVQVHVEPAPAVSNEACSAHFKGTATCSELVGLLVVTATGK